MEKLKKSMASESLDHDNWYTEGDEAMKNKPGLVLLHGTYIFRLRYPPHAAKALNKSHFKVSLRTKDPKEASRRYSAVMLDFHAQVARALSTDTQQFAAVAKPASISQLRAVALEKVRTRWRAAELELWKPHASFDTEDDPERVLHAELKVLRGSDDEVYRGFLWAAEQALLTAGLDAERNSIEVLSNFLRRGDIDICETCLRHYKGDTSHALRDKLFTSLNDFNDGIAAADAPLGAHSTRSSEALFSPDSSASKTVNQVIALFFADPQRSNLSQKNAGGYATGFKLLREVVGGNSSLLQVSREHARKIQAVLEHLPPNASKRFPRLTLIEAANNAKRDKLPAISRTTAKNILSTLSSFFNWAVAEHLIKASLFDELKPLQDRQAIEDDRRPYSPVELKQLFSNAMYSLPYAARGAVKPGRYWVPLLALYHGARMNELCQLDTSDVAIVEGTWCMKITDQSLSGNKKQLKTRSSHRTTPLHPIFHALGFIDYVLATREMGESRLFSDLTLASTGYYSDNFSKWFLRYRRGQGVGDSTVDFHSFRHGFRDACRAMKISTEDAVRIAGWSRGDAVESRYGRGAPLKHLVTELGKIRFPTVEELLPALQGVIKDDEEESSGESSNRAVAFMPKHVES